ncbi:deoxycytidine triphosphate deaminase (dcD-2) [Sulfolobus islandicus Y.G.57.14]|jgi:dCTP deaminase|uniref:Deoxycytidine triphosphate deaminase n=6 Tax=Saccharolobus TaxID=2100760 RepID=A0A0E3MDS3_SACSO|nr:MULTISPECIES: deoxycytidine triphosphate deaminase [Sulfolobaceae]ACP36523.1 deoxycytidine triphosphate deaminase (dcD-2) [Sulfolobus islandicus L.S.2.15]ACP46777.1 deoxycytidine triphosphate deaminase (dcD-2) [Sulfolobus islandicus Y.G.57.14]ACP47532.1 deoxycytidine triphosphate deaminase (dcD-2) [Sulfolobus islandicus Y.N.15.51]ADB88318.1 deoxycytidine triphosphate deaminase (dcD-2) [Sulfolobus islandicus L.D.8.5]AKA73115.1 deoxycytidine triphosphate deaminase [Saccharolobus solfataricus]
MILSHQSIKKLLGKVIMNYVEENVRENGYDLRICGEKYYEVEEGAKLPSIKAKIREIPFKEVANLSPLNTYLFESCEEFNMPDNLAVLITLKSTMARNGFLAPPTVIDAGYKGKIYLAITSVYGSSLAKGISTHHLIFLELDQKTERIYSGKYQGGIPI